MVSPTDPWFEDLSGTYPHDPAKAKALLAEAGHATGLSLRLRIPTLPGPPAARFIQAQLKDVGIEVKIEEIDFARWLDQVYGAHDYDMTIVSHVEGRDLGAFANPEYYWGLRQQGVREAVRRGGRGYAGRASRQAQGGR